MEFVTETGTKGIDEGERKKIRRHVMLSKNQGRQPKRPRPSRIPGASVFVPEGGHTHAGSSQRTIPRRVGSDMSFLEFPDVAQPALLHETLQFCATTNEKMFMLKQCIAFNPEDLTAICLQPFAHDALYFNTMMFTSHMFMDLVFWQTMARRRNGISRDILPHYGKALNLLQCQMVDVQQISNMTVMSVILLALHALLSGDEASAKNHVIGLSRLVGLRFGTIYAFGSHTKQVIEVLR
jgi:hypothetical protein